MSLPEPPPRPPLTRARRQAIAGVSAGLAEHLGWPVAVVRALFVVASMAAGSGVVLYLWFWVFVPLPVAAPGDRPPLERRVPVAWLLLALALCGAAVTMLGLIGSPYYSWWFTTSVFTTACAVMASLWAGFFDLSDPNRGQPHVAVIRFTAVALLVALITLQIVAAPMSWSPTLTIAASLFAVLGIATVFVPVIVARFAELQDARVERIREEQRSRMAAHLHDSVLQTLALIQNRAGASSEVARIARAQERELRSWLYDADDPADSDLPTDLREHAAALELDYPVRIDVVAAGESTERASGEVAAAAREAMLNAARHAGGDVSVYIESRPDLVEVFIRDRGPGFALDAVPSDRLGVRQSVIGRMRRIGGTGEVRAGAGQVGTEVRLRLELGRTADPRAGGEAPRDLAARRDRTPAPASAGPSMQTPRAAAAPETLDQASGGAARAPATRGPAVAGSGPVPPDGHHTADADAASQHSLEAPS